MSITQVKKRFKTSSTGKTWNNFLHQKRWRKKCENKCKEFSTYGELTVITNLPNILSAKTESFDSVFQFLTVLFPLLLINFTKHLDARKLTVPTWNPISFDLFFKIPKKKETKNVFVSRHSGKYPFLDFHLWTPRSRLLKWYFLLFTSFGYHKDIECFECNHSSC